MSPLAIILVIGAIVSTTCAASNCTRFAAFYTDLRFITENQIWKGDHFVVEGIRQPGRQPLFGRIKELDKNTTIAEPFYMCPNNTLETCAPHRVLDRNIDRVCRFPETNTMSAGYYCNSQWIFNQTYTSFQGRDLPPFIIPAFDALCDDPMHNYDLMLPRTIKVILPGASLGVRYYTPKELKVHNTPWSRCFDRALFEQELAVAGVEVVFDGHKAVSPYDYFSFQHDPAVEVLMPPPSMNSFHSITFIPSTRNKIAISVRLPLC